MYICKSCGEKFENPITSHESMGEHFGRPVYEDIYRCPYCQSENFEEAERCFVCGDYFLANHADDCCDECKEVLSNELNALKDKYGLDSIDSLQDWICALYEW